MNKEEADNLKNGQEIFVKAIFNDIHADEQAAENKPKYDPCRPYKEGDIVKHVEKDGRTYFDAPPVGEECRVIEDESKNGTVCVTIEIGEVIYTHEVPF